MCGKLYGDDIWQHVRTCCVQASEQQVQELQGTVAAARAEAAASAAAAADAAAARDGEAAHARKVESRLSEERVQAAAAGRVLAEVEQQFTEKVFFHWFMRTGVTRGAKSWLHHHAPGFACNVHHTSESLNPSRCSAFTWGMRCHYSEL